jgi:thiol-disulfide isomerase/thioredoxin
MKNNFILTLSFLFLCFWAKAQEEGQQYFQVTFDEFSPPTQDLIMSFEGKEPMAFMANDINGTEYFLKNFKGKVVFVYFWNGECSSCLQHVNSLNLLQKEESEKLQIISFVDEAKEEATLLAQQNGVEFPVLTNGKLLGEAAYGIELGYPRLFAIDTEGKVVTVIPQAALEDKADIYLLLKDLLDKVSNK